MYRASLLPSQGPMYSILYLYICYIYSIVLQVHRWNKRVLQGICRPLQEPSYKKDVFVPPMSIGWLLLVHYHTTTGALGLDLKYAPQHHTWRCCTADTLAAKIEKEILGCIFISSQLDSEASILQCLGFLDMTIPSYFATHKNTLTPNLLLFIQLTNSNEPRYIIQWGCRKRSTKLREYFQ